jgi:hypothetical protein
MYNRYFGYSSAPLNTNLIGFGGLSAIGSDGMLMYTTGELCSTEVHISEVLSNVGYSGET